MPADAAEAALLRRLRTHALTIEHPDPRIVEAVEDAKRMVWASAAGGEPIDAFALITAGEHDRARAAMAACADASHRPGGASALAVAWLAARYFAWTGDTASASAWLAPVLEALTSAQAAPSDPGAALVARDLLPLAEAAGGVPAGLSSLAAAARPAPEGDPAIATMLTALGDDRQGTMAGLAAGTTDAAVAAWIASATAEPQEPARLLVTLAAGIVGADPVADRGRLRLALHVPAAWPEWGIRNLRIGSAAVELHIRRDDRTVTIRADQTDGPLPLTLILEPTVHAPVSAARVDGTPADLAWRAYADRVIAPVQLLLESPRELVLDLAPARR